MQPIRIVAASAALISSLVLAASAAGAVTNDQLYQTADSIHQELNLIMEVAGAKPRVDHSRTEVTTRQPRHVLNKAHEVLLKMEEVKALHDLPDREVPESPVREVHPEDVMELLVEIQADIQALRPAFGVKKPSPKVAKAAKKSPTDVYKLLQEVSLQLDGLDIPPIRDYAVYRLAIVIIADLDHIWDAKGRTGKVQMTEHATGKTAGENYDHAVELLAELQVLSQQAGFEVPGGVVLPNPREGELKPCHVQEILHYAQAEVNAMKLDVGVLEPSEFDLPQHSDVLPSNTYDALTVARMMVQALEAGS